MNILVLNGSPRPTGETAGREQLGNLSAAFFVFKGLKPRIFFDWDVRGRATSQSKKIRFFMALPPRTRWRCLVHGRLCSD